MNRFLINGSSVLTLEHVAPILSNASVIVQNDRIEAVGAHAEMSKRGPFDKILGGPDSVVMPGLCNGHYHCGPGNTVRVGETDGHLETWRLPILGALMSPAHGTGARDALYAATQYFACGMVRAGITSCLDFVHVQPAMEDYGLRAIIDAYVDSGFRASIAAGAMNRNAYVYEDDERFLTSIPAELATRVRSSMLTAGYVPEDEYISVIKDVHGRHDGSGNERIRVFLSPYGPQWCTDSLLLKIRDAASTLETGIQLHLLETPYQKQFALRTYGKTEVAHLHELGLLGKNVSCAHAVWLTDDDVELLGDTGTMCVHNPLSNLRLGSGIAPVRNLLRRNVCVALGTDGMGFRDDNDMFDQLRLADYLQRPPGLGEKFLNAIQWLELATKSGARVIGLGDNWGTLRPGAKADLLLIDIRRIGAIGMNVESIDQLVLQYVAPQDIRTTMINGKIVMDEGRILTMDETALTEELKGRFPEMLENFRRRRPLMKELEPYVEAYFRHWDAESAQHYN